jgi:hypothetical protein
VKVNKLRSNVNMLKRFDIINSFIEIESLWN